MPVFCIILKMNVLKKLRVRQGSKMPVSSERLLMIRGYEKIFLVILLILTFYLSCAESVSPPPRRETCLKFLTDSERKIWFIK